jgi:hypothetical protein
MQKSPITLVVILIAFLSAIPIAILGGLIGLGGAEFRLPVLAGRSEILRDKPSCSIGRHV